MKKQIFSTILVMGLASLPALSLAHNGELLTPQAVLQEIFQAQNVQDAAQIDCTKVADEQFEELGDAWMEQIHPGESHEYMDQMMGGEGSESLRQAHIQMGRNYIGCGYGFTGYGMMGGNWGMMNNYSYGPMMGWSGGASPGNFFYGLAWSAVGAAIVLAGIKFFGKK